MFSNMLTVEYTKINYYNIIVIINPFLNQSLNTMHNAFCVDIKLCYITQTLIAPLMYTLSQPENMHYFWNF